MNGRECVQAAEETDEALKERSALITKDTVPTDRNEKCAAVHIKTRKPALW